MGERNMGNLCNACNKVGIAWADENRKMLFFVDFIFILIAIILACVAVAGLSSDSGTIQNAAWTKIDNIFSISGLTAYTNLWGIKLVGTFPNFSSCDASKFPMSWNDFKACSNIDSAKT